jgi:hypothetical protein
MPWLVNEQPFAPEERRLTICGAEVLVAAFRPSVWISVTAPWVLAPLPDDVPRFLALVDTGFNGALFLREDHLRRLVGDVDMLPERSPGHLSLADDRRETHRRYQARVWLHGYGHDAPTPAFDLDVSRGIVVWSEPPAEEPTVLGEGFFARVLRAVGLRGGASGSAEHGPPIAPLATEGPPLPTLGAMALWPRKLKVAVDSGQLSLSVWVP